MAQLGTTFAAYEQDRNAAASVRELYYNTPVKEEAPEAPAPAPALPRMDAKFAALLERNPDLVGWLAIDGINVDDPIVQADDNTYYLHRNFDQADSKSGSLFMDYRNRAAAEDRHTIIYGHRMKDGSMFGRLNRFTEEDFFREKGAISFETLHERYTVEVFSVYRTTTDFYYIRTEFEDDEDYESFLQEIRDKSIYPSHVPVMPDDRIITLSTCDYWLDREEGRLVVHGKLVKQDSFSGEPKG